MRNLIILFSLCVLFGGCCVPDTRYTLTNRGGRSIDVISIDSNGLRKQHGTLAPGSTRVIGRNRTLIVKENADFTFRLPSHVTKWIPKAVGDGRFRYDLSTRVSDKIVWVSNPPALKAENVPVSVRTKEGGSMLFPIVSLRFPIYPVNDSDDFETSDKEFEARWKKDVFEVGRRLEMKFNGKKYQNILEPIDWSAINVVFRGSEH